MLASPVSGLLRSSSACAASCRPVCPPDKLWTILRWKVWWADKATRLYWGKSTATTTTTTTTAITSETQLHFLPPLALATSDLDGTWDLNAVREWGFESAFTEGDLIVLRPLTEKYFVHRRARLETHNGPFSLHPAPLTQGASLRDKCSGHSGSQPAR